jgi:pSer/pThr/pTyr-binding forkhead associated (FHA) protein
VKRYSLILFDFDASSLNARNLRVIDEIQSTKGIKITSILGATDMFGDAKRNAELALDRAKAVGVLLKADPSIIKGNSAYEGTPNASPEGRFYNRTVIIETKEVGE